MKPCRIQWHQSINCIIPAHCILASDAAGRRHLRSADTMKLLVRRTIDLSPAADFAVSAAAIWKCLQADLRLSSCSVQTYMRKLKTFCRCDNVAHLRNENHLFCALQMHSLLLLLFNIIIILEWSVVYSESDTTVALDGFPWWWCYNEDWCSLVESHTNWHSTLWW